MKIAIIGGGAAGMSTAWLLDRTHNVTVFEKQPILGGNIRTLNKNVQGVDLPDGVYVDNGVIEFQLDHFVNFHKLMAALGVQTERINGGSSSLYLPDGRYILGPGIVNNGTLGRVEHLRMVGRLLRIWPDYRKLHRDMQQSPKHRPVSDFLDERPWGQWQKMLLMYGYSIPYAQIADFPAELAFTILRNADRGTRWSRIVGGVYTYIEKIIASLSGQVHTGVTITGIARGEQGVTITLQSGESADFDKVIFAVPPQHVLRLLSDPSDDERRRFGAWRDNDATTVIHTDLSLYDRYGGRRNMTEFDVFRKADGDAGYNAYLNRLIGVPEHAPHYCLAYNLDEAIDPQRIIQRQHHNTPLYTVKALANRDAVRATNGDNHTYHAGAWMDNGLHEGAVNSALAISKLLGGRQL